MKRPLFLVCIALMILIISFQYAGESEEDSPAFQTEALLLKAAEQNRIITIKGCVAACNTVSQGKSLSIFQISVLEEDRVRYSLLSKLKLNVTTENMEIEPGDVLVLKGEYVPYQEARNPGNFDAKTYYHAEAVIGKLQDPKILSVTKPEENVVRMLYRIRERLRISFEQILSEKQGRILSAICLGEKGNMEQEWKMVYQNGGISHILAVSGLHVTLIGMTVFRLLRKIYISYGKSALISGIFSSCYVIMTGAGVSALRALFMFFFWLGAQICGRKYDMRTAMAAAALYLVCSNPLYINTASFWLSFGAVAVISILLPCVQKTCWIKNPIVQSVTGSAVIFLGTLPITLYFYYQTAPWSVIANLFVTSLMPYLMGMGLLSSAAGIVWKYAGVFLAVSAAWLLNFFEVLCEFEQKLPMALWIPGRPSLPVILLYYVLLALTGAAAKRQIRTVRADGKRKGINRNRLLWLGVFLICLGLMNRRIEQKLSITCLDVGQGDGAWICFPDGIDCLIDGGSSSQKNVWKYQINDTLKYYGADVIEYIFLSHADSDHTNGILEVLSSYSRGVDGRNTAGITIENLILPYTRDPGDFSELTALARQQGISVLRMKKGDRIEQNEWSITCIAPEKETLSGDKNQDSMVLMLQYQQFRMLFTGDLEGTAEQGLDQVQADILKVGHHGSKNGSSQAFLEKVAPKAAIISCGENNRYGHPAQETVERLLEAGAQIFETKKSGAIQIQSDGKHFWVRETVK